MRIVHSTQSIVHRQRSPTSYEPRATSFLVVLFLACLILPISAQAATYYVSYDGNDANSGTDTGHPFRTIEKGVEVASSGDTVKVDVEGGGYFALSSTRVGSASKTNDLKYLRKGFLDVTLFGADPTGNEESDSTVAIQKAVFAARSYRYAAFFPNQADGARAVYLVSDVIKCRMDVMSPSLVGESQPNVLIGSTKGKGRPIIKLKKGAPRFSNAGIPTPVFWFWAVPARWYPQYEGSTKPEDSEDDISFDQIFKGIDIDLNGNPGAYGIKHAGCQGSAIEDVYINATGAYAGLGKFGVLGCAIYNVEVEGGKYALCYDGSDTLSKCNGHGIIIGCTFKNQEEAVFYLSNVAAQAVLMTGFHIEQKEGVPLNICYVNSWGRGGMNLVDGIIERDGGQIFNVSALDSKGDTRFYNIYMRNVYVKGADSVANGWQIDNKDNWTRIKEYVYTNDCAKNIIDGNVNTPNEYKSKIENVNVTINQLINGLVKKHLWDEAAFPSFEDDDAYDVKDLGAKGDGVIDDTAALQNAIDQHPKLFLSKGKYIVSGPLTLKNNTQLFGITSQFSKINASSSWTPPGEQVILTTVDDKNAKTLLAFLSVNSSVNEIVGQGGFTPIEWRAGRNSMTRNVLAGSFGNWNNQNVNYHRFRINKGGGGRHFSIRGSWLKPYNNISRGLLIEGTSEPLYIYAFNTAEDPDYASVEITNSRNVRFYYPTFEQSDTSVKIYHSENISVFSGHKNNEIGTNRGGIEVFESNNILVSDFVPNHSNTNGNPLKEIYAGVTSVIPNDANVALYKRGDPGFENMSIMYGDVSEDGAITAYDAALTAQAAVGSITLTPQQTQAADVSGDGKVTAYDAALIAERAVGLITKFPVEG